MERMETQLRTIGHDPSLGERTETRNLNDSGDYKMRGFMGNKPGQLEI